MWLFAITVHSSHKTHVDTHFLSDERIITLFKNMLAAIQAYNSRHIGGSQPI